MHDKDKLYMFLEDMAIAEEIVKRDKNDDGTRYTSEDVIRLRQKRNNIKQFVQDNINGVNNKNCVDALLLKHVLKNAYQEAFKEDHSNEGENLMRNILVEKMLGKRIDDVYFDTNQIHIQLEDSTTISLTAEVNVDNWPVLQASVHYIQTEEGNI